MSSKKILFSASDGSDGYQLWVTDGTSAGTSLLFDINPDGNSSPSDITPLGNGTAVFEANDGTHGYELWVTNGTAAGTSLVKDIYPGSIGSAPAYITAIGNDKAVFAANDGTHGNELWVTNGTSAGTYLVKDIDPGAASSNPHDITAFDVGEALFSANDGTDGYELWVTNGTTAGTSLVKDINPGSAGSNPSGITSLGNGVAVFSANDGTHGYELWMTNGTSAGTSLVKDIDPGSTSSYPTDIISLGDGKVLFEANDGTDGAELWVTNGTSAGTYLVKDINPGPASSYPHDITVLSNGEALFSANDGTDGYELWVTNGTSAGTSLVKDINPGSAGANPTDITSLGNGEALFAANDGTDGTELWVTNGTAAGTSLVKDINPGSRGSYPSDITAIGNGMALFKATNGTGYELWITNGTAAGTSLVQGNAASAIASNPSDLTVLQAAACFAAGTRIRSTDGEVPVESLRVGDQVLTPLGVPRPIHWIGFRRIDLKRHADPRRVMPVRIRAGALADGVPRRDLLLSADHALFIDGMLVPARLLLNGASIVTETAVQHITYYHVELDSHDILLAEGVPAESYLDTGNRGMFENAASPLRLHPDFAADQHERETRSCAPLAVRPDVVEPVWRRLATRAEELGWQLPTPPDLTDEPNLRLLTGTRCLTPAVAANGRFQFVLPPAGETLRLVSRAAQPQVAKPWTEDSRRLGVLIRRLTWRGRRDVRAIEMDDPILEQGWWMTEWHAGRPCRWTDGDAKLPLLGAGILEVEVSGSMQYPIDHAAAGHRRTPGLAATAGE